MSMRTYFQVYVFFSNIAEQLSNSNVNKGHIDTDGNINHVIQQQNNS